MIQAILFDFNGVIIDDERLQMKAYMEAFAPEGVTLTEEDYFAGLGMDDATFIRAMFERKGIEADDEQMRRVAEQKATRHRALITEQEELPLFPGVVTFVKALARRYPLGVVSMSRRADIDFALERAKLLKQFTVVVSAEDVSACKPDPACYRRALEKLNERKNAAGHILSLQPQECLVIEDSPPGIRAARSAGMRTLGVTNTVADKALREAGADVVTASLADWTDDALHHVFNQR
jgi:HAD superfamily hydrolase (TIGR01509 family)